MLKDGLLRLAKNVDEEKKELKSSFDLRLSNLNELEERLGEMTKDFEQVKIHPI